MESLVQFSANLYMAKLQVLLVKHQSKNIVQLIESLQKWSIGIYDNIPLFPFNSKNQKKIFA
jgi:hypothetical protein